MDKRIKKNWTKSILLNIAVVIFILIMTDMMYETNDEFAIASRIRDGYAEVNFVNYYLCLILIKIQLLIPEWNAYVLFQLTGSFISFVCILKMIMDKTESRIIQLMSVMVIALYSIDHYCTLQFTKTSSLLAAAGLLLMADFVLEKRSLDKRGVGSLILSVLLLYSGAALRIEGIYTGVVFAGAYVFFWIIINHGKILKDGYLKKERIAIYFFMIMMVGGCLVFNHMSYMANTRTAELKEYKEYSIARSNVVDFGVYENYEANKDSYDEIGISKNDLNLIDKWVFDYDGAASVENLTKIGEIANAGKDHSSITKAVRSCIKTIIKSVRNMSHTGIHIIVMCALSIWLILCCRSYHFIYPVLIGMITFALYLTLFYMGRPAYRAMYTIDIGATVWLLYYLASASEKTAEEYVEKHIAAEKREKNKSLLVCGACVVIICIALFIPSLSSCRNAYDSMSNKVMNKELSDYIRDNSDIFFVFSTTEKKQDKSYLTPLRAPNTQDYKNVMGTGSWGTMSPYVLGKLAEYGMYNPIKDLIDNENALYIGNKRIEKLVKYYNKWYGTKETRIDMEEVGEAGGYKVWKVVTAS